MPTEVEVLTPPVEQLIDMLSATLAEIDQATVGLLSPCFLGVLVRDVASAPVFCMPAGQDPQEREDVVRVLVLRQIAGSQ
jgi:hypothetical protein